MKDKGLADLSRRANVAQFVSFGPGPDPQVRHIVFADAVGAGSGVAEAVGRLLRSAPSASVNVRSFRRGARESSEFVKDLRSVDEVVAHVRRMAASGLFTIVNEYLDPCDGGVSGVAFGDTVEFTPDDIPRGVEKPGAATLPRSMATALLRTVYGFAPDLPHPHNARVEFSIHPQRVGARHDHTVAWEITEDREPPATPRPHWPNRFSELIGDKAHGLLIADHIGLHVPHTTVVCRRVAPFSFGAATGSREVWLRTAPRSQDPGRFTTTREWIDPFTLLQREDPTGERIASVLAQAEVRARFAGGFLSTTETNIDGGPGYGDAFMLGRTAPQPLPDVIVKDVRLAIERARADLGWVRGEWTHDGDRVWMMQLHVVDRRGGGTLVPGEATRWLTYDPRDGIAVLHGVVDRARAEGAGVALLRPVGVTSHVGDVLRNAGVPARWTGRWVPSR